MAGRYGGGRGRAQKIGVFGHFRDETPWWYALLHPIGICIFIYAMLRSASTTLAGGGIEWRETRYPLEELKDNVI